MQAGREGATDAALNRRPVVNDLRVAQAHDGVSAKRKLGVVRDVLRALRA